MKPRFLLNFALVSVLLASFSCKKEEEGCKTMRDHPKDFLDYWFFPQGSWWVYQRTDTVGLIDTVYCYSSQSVEERGGGDEAPGCSLVYSMSTMHSNQIFYYNNEGGKIFFTSFLGSNKSVIHFSEDIPYSLCLFQSNSCGAYFLDYPISIKDSLVNKFFIILDTFDIADSTFKVDYSNVIHIAGEGGKAHIYFSKNIGIVKKVYKDSTIWLLTKYFINK